MFFTYYAKNNPRMDSEGDFTDLEFPRVIDSSSDDFIEDFYVPLLSRSKNTDVVSAISPRIGFDLLLVESQI